MAAETDLIKTDEDIGSYIEMFSARSDIEGQDGGMVSAFLIWGMRKGVFDTAIVVRNKENGDAEAVVAHGVDDVVRAKGTKYFRVNIASKLKELLDQGSSKIAVVCTPCQVRAVRKIQEPLNQKSLNFKLTVIGLFCFEAFNYARLESEIKKLLGVDLNKVEKSQIRKGKFTISEREKEYSCKVSALHKAVEKGCFNCKDFSAQLADIAVGSVGSQQGYSTVIVRTEEGKMLLRDLKIEKTGVEETEIKKLSKIKRERAEKHAHISLQQTDTLEKPT
jgi:coenzyme F420-reducing hydrogenase beta subunit